MNKFIFAGLTFLFLAIIGVMSSIFISWMWDFTVFLFSCSVASIFVGMLDRRGDTE